ncbi:hypothetical protein [Rummeliibacillus pycnus]
MIEELKFSLFIALLIFAGLFLVEAQSISCSSYLKEIWSLQILSR